jgi:hypothetical protein
MIRVMQIPLQKERLRAVPKEERTLFLLLGYAANQITMFQKLLIFSSNKTPSETVEQRISAAQTQMLVRFLIGAVHEAWSLIQKRFLGAPPGKEYQDRLNHTGREALDGLKKYFGSSNVLSTLRNNYAYHHPLDGDVDAAFSAAYEDTTWNDYWNVYLSESNMNSFHFASDVVIVHGIMQAIKGADVLIAHEKITRDASMVAKMITEFILDFSAAFLAKHFSVGTPELPEKAHPVVPGSSTSRAGGRNLKRGWGSSFFECLAVCPHAGGSSTALWARVGLSTDRSLASHSTPSRARRRRPPNGILIAHIGLPGTTG